MHTLLNDVTLMHQVTIVCSGWGSGCRWTNSARMILKWNQSFQTTWPPCMPARWGKCAANSNDVTLAPKDGFFAFFWVVILLLWFTQTIMTCFYLIVVRISGNTSTKTEWLNPHVFKMSRDLLFWIRVYWQILTYLQTYRIFPAIPGVGTMATPWHQRDL